MVLPNIGDQFGIKAKHWGNKIVIFFKQKNQHHMRVFFKFQARHYIKTLKKGCLCDKNLGGICKQAPKAKGEVHPKEHYVLHAAVPHHREESCHVPHVCHFFCISKRTVSSNPLVQDASSKDRSEPPITPLFIVLSPCHVQRITTTRHGVRFEQFICGWSH